MGTRRATKKLDADGLWNYALRILGHRAHSLGELKKKLMVRGDSPHAVSSVLEKIREYGLADDIKFSDAFASARLQNRGFSSFRVLRDLRAKSVPSSVAQKAVEKVYSGVDESDLARRFLEKKYKGKNLQEFLKEEKQLASAYRRLRAVGFGSRTSLDVLRLFSKSTLSDDPQED